MINLSCHEGKFIFKMLMNFRQLPEKLKQFFKELEINK